MLSQDVYTCKTPVLLIFFNRPDTFEKVFTEPFLKCGLPGEWNSSESGHPYAFRDDDGKAYLFYQGSSDMGKTWYLSKVKIDFDKNNIPYIVKGEEKI